MKYKVGDKVRIKSLDWYNENKNNRNEIIFENNPHWRFVANQSDYCGQIATITSVSKTAYRLESIPWNWTDEMIEGLAEEETKPKFKVGDRVITNKGYIGKFEGWVSDYQVRVLFPESGCNVVIHPKNLKLAEDEMSLDKAGQITDFEYEGLAYTLPDGYIFKDDNGNVINATKIVLEKKKKEYPKTYKECCKVMNYCCNPVATKTTHKEELIRKFQFLILYRDAYWKIAGEEMGLGKPWEPDYTKDRYIICRLEDKILRGHRISGLIEHFILEFPTEEMRDAFYENFKSLIEECKELL